MSWLEPLTSPAAWTSPDNCSAASIFTTLLMTVVAKGMREARIKAARTRDIVSGEFDFVVVGAGSAGCVVASRLSENPEWRVLLLEAGAEETDLNMVPAFYNSYLRDPFFDWHYTTQRSGWDAGQFIPRGKGMGGCSAVNALHFTRGNKFDYDNWAALGNRGWGYDDVLPYFKKSENLRDEDVARDTVHHATGGPQDTESDRYKDPNIELYLQAWQELGYTMTPDINGDQHLGLSRPPSSAAGGERRSTNRAFLTPAVRARKNLVVQTHAYVRRLVVADGRAVGVEYDGPEGYRTARATKEVVVSAGSYNSPQVLMLSGIGPKAHLQEVGIVPVLDLPGVGQRLHDHVQARGQTVQFELRGTANEATVEKAIAVIKEYVEHRSGPLTATADPASLFMRSAQQPENDPRPDIQIALGATHADHEPSPNCDRDETAGTFYNQMHGFVNNLRPKSRGEIRLNPKDPYGAPLIFHNVFGDQDDLKPIIEGHQLLVKLNATSRVFHDRGVVLRVARPAQCADLEFNSDEFWVCAFQGQGRSNGHPTSTCSMGPDSDPLAVVNERLQVRGVGNIRVVDASIMPEVTTANTNAAAVMIGEKGAALIREDWARGGATTERVPVDPATTAAPTAAPTAATQSSASTAALMPVLVWTAVLLARSS